jgi:hypothetical protein
LHATQAEAAADFEAATCLLDAGISKSVLIPRPIARPAAEPRLVLYEFDPWTTLWEYMDMYRSRRALRHCTESVARALARLHGSQLRFRGAAPDPAMDSLPALVARTETIFQGRTTGSEEIAPLLRRLVAWIQQQAANMCPPVPAPIFGARDWSWIYYGVDSRFYLHHFEACRHADPGLDLGGFAADLLGFTVTKHDDELWRICAEALLRNYNEQAAHPIEETTLRFYTALALVDRFRRARPDWRALRGAVSALLRSLGRLAATQRTVIGQTGLLPSRAAR